jgi:heme exporter protein C
VKSGFLDRSLAVARKDWIAESRSLSGLAGVGLFSLVTLAAISFSVGAFGADAGVLAALLWVLLLFSGLSGLAQGFVREVDAHTAPHLRLLATPHEVLAGKALSNLWLLVLVEVLVVPLFLVVMAPPVAWITVVAFALSAWWSIVYLRGRDLVADAKAAIWAELGLVACVLATVTGSIFAKGMWGSYWNWDPRETSIFLLLLIYAAYVTLRTSIEDDERRASLSATYSVIAVVTVPFLIFVVPRIYFSLHPDPLINTQGKRFMETRMYEVVMASFAGFLAIFWWMYRIHLRMALARLGAAREAH